MKQTNEMYWPSWRTSEVKWLSSVETTWNTLTLIVKSVFPSHAGGWLKCHIDNLASFEQEINISLVAKRIFFYKETHIFVIPSWKKKKVTSFAPAQPWVFLLWQNNHKCHHCNYFKKIGRLCHFMLTLVMNNSLIKKK